jgi:hypothetical protein
MKYKDKYLFFYCRNIGLERENESILSSYTSINSDNQYEINDDPSPYCQSTLKSLTIGQKQICLLHADHMPVVIQGKIFVFDLFEEYKRIL